MRMRTLATVVAIALGLISSTAAAEYRPKHYLDAAIGGGLSDGLGDLRRGPELHGLSGAGGEVAFDLLYGANERWSFGVYAGYARFGNGSFAGSNTAVLGVMGGAQTRYRFATGKRVDPYIGVGAGYRGLTQLDEQGRETLRNGLQLGRGRLGVDFTVARGTRIGPVIGSDVTTFNARDLTVFIFGGMSGTFDLLSFSDEKASATD